ncbi:hypothetical protein VTJ04DRAFT_10882 [Mycothermus thermophilus]|uniref:uncharacterized protein n=1 Tax=Humicola insolens TaxID=85995 RepID=UPI003743F854
MTILHSAIKTPPALHATIVAWYKAALAPLGYKAAASFQNDLVIGFADASGAVEWWVKSTAAESPSHTEEDKTAPRIVGSHFAFAAKDRAAVDAFHEAAVAAGGKSIGAPGVREYGPSYYAAYVLDPVGNNIEAVCMGDQCGKVGSELQD